MLQQTQSLFLNSHVEYFKTEGVKKIRKKVEPQNQIFPWHNTEKTYFFLPEDDVWLLLYTSYVKVS